MANKNGMIFLQMHNLRYSGLFVDVTDARWLYVGMCYEIAIKLSALRCILSRGNAIVLVLFSIYSVFRSFVTWTFIRLPYFGWFYPLIAIVYVTGYLVVFFLRSLRIYANCFFMTLTDGTLDMCLFTLYATCDIVLQQFFLFPLVT